MNKEGKLFWMILFVAATLAAAGGFFAAQYSVDSALAYQMNPVDQLKTSSGGFTGQDNKAPKDLRLIAFQIVQTLLGLVGTALVIVIMYAGFMWWSARGNDDKVTKTKSTLRNAVIGMIIISMSYAITTFVFRWMFYDDMDVSIDQKAQNQANQTADQDKLRNN